MSRSMMARWYFFVAIGFVLASAFPTGAALAQSGYVLPPQAKPKGYSLAEMARKTAVFNTSKRQAILYPRGIPFQILYAKPGSTGTTSTFIVEAGTMFYVPVVYTDNSPSQLIGPFPKNAIAAKNYFFNPSQLGGHDFRIVIDGNTTPIGPRYLAGPVTTLPLPDGGGTRYIVSAAFVTPLNKGMHTVSIHSVFSGALIGSVLTFDYTYTVIVKGDHS